MLVAPASTFVRTQNRLSATGSFFALQIFEGFVGGVQYQFLIFGRKMIKSGCRLTRGVDTLILPKLGGRVLGNSFGRPCGTRTHDTLIKSQVLYQTELTAHRVYFCVSRSEI